jgi:hypothetical protein
MLRSKVTTTVVFAVAAALSTFGIGHATLISVFDQTDGCAWFVEPLVKRQSGTPFPTLVTEHVAT